MAVSDHNRKKLEAIGVSAIRRELAVGNVQYLTGEAQRDEARKWVAEQDIQIAQETEAAKQREADTFRYVKLTLWAAVAAVLVGVIGVAVTWFHK